MASAFNDMTANLRHWYQEAQTHSERLENTLGRLQQAHDATLEALSRALEPVTTRPRAIPCASRTTHCVSPSRWVWTPNPRCPPLGGTAARYRQDRRPRRDPPQTEPADAGGNGDHAPPLRAGPAIVDGIPYLERAAAVIGCHHERFDGGGYPRGLARREHSPDSARLRRRRFAGCHHQ